MVRVNGNFLLDLDIVNPFQDRETMAHAHDGHFFQLFMSQGHQGLTDDFILCGITD